MTVKVSVCVLAYNRPHGLEQTLASLAAQTRLPDEVVVSDDCSTNDTKSVALQWVGRLPGFQYVRNSVNLGMPGNLNVAIRRTVGSYVANLHDADTFAPTLLERWESALDANPSAGFVFSGVGGWPHRTRQGGGVILHDVAPLTPGRSFYERHLIHRFSSIVWGTVMARRSAYDLLLPFDEQFGYISDVDMWMRMCFHYDVAYVRGPLILLDHTPQFRGEKVNWLMVEWARKIQLLNLQRFYGTDPVRMVSELKLHQAAARRFLARRFVGRLGHGDWSGARRSLEMWGEWKLFGGLDATAIDA
jgi:glycosyltransferase involved in cell wall biosynthesis